MKITITPNERDFDISAAWRIIGQILNKPNSIIGLSTGQTTIGIHAVVAEIFKNYPFSTSKVTVFGVDELAMVPSTLHNTCTNRLLEQIVKPIRIPKENFIMPLTLSDDYEKESTLFESRLIKGGRIDLQMLGIGIDGHLGMNLPGSPFESNTRLVPLSGELEQRIRKMSNLSSDCQLAGITLGIRTIMNIKKIVLVAKGKHKANIIKQAILGPVTPDIPASVLQLHTNCEFLLDLDAASELPETDQ
jgi:glucosamine-6-phosphate deaminase